MSKRVTVPMAALAVGALVGGTATSAHAAKPEQQPRKPMVETVDLAKDKDAPTFQCGEKIIRFTAGEAIFQAKELPGPRFFELVKLRNARATDGTMSYAAHGGGSFRESEEGGSFRIRVTFVGSGGDVERVNSVFTVGEEGESVVDRGSCTVIFEAPVS